MILVLFSEPCHTHCEAISASLPLTLNCTSELHKTTIHYWLELADETGPVYHIWPILWIMLCSYCCNQICVQISDARDRICFSLGHVEVQKVLEELEWFITIFVSRVCQRELINQAFNNGRWEAHNQHMAEGVSRSYCLEKCGGWGSQL